MFVYTNTAGNWKPIVTSELTRETMKNNLPNMSVKLKF